MVMITRRGLLKGLIAAPAIVAVTNIMPVRSIERLLAPPPPKLFGMDPGKVYWEIVWRTANDATVIKEIVEAEDFITETMWRPHEKGTLEAAHMKVVLPTGKTAFYVNGIPDMYEGDVLHLPELSFTPA